MLDIEHGPLRNAKFFFQAERFTFRASVALGQNELRLYLSEGSDPDPVRQLVVQIQDGAQRTVDGIAQSKSLLVALLDAAQFLKLHEALYDARERKQALVIALESDGDGRIVTFEPRYMLISERAPALLDTSFSELEPLAGWVDVA